MPLLQVDIAHFPLQYWLSLLCLLGGSIYALRRIAQPWSPPFLAVLAMVAGWYMIEPVYLPEYFESFSDRDVSTAFGCVLTFLITLSLTAPLAVDAFSPRQQTTTDLTFSIHPDELVRPVVILWLCLLAIGTLRMDGDIFAALFPIGGRTGSNMWSRAAAEDAGPAAFLISTGAYLYVLVLSTFGILLPGIHNWKIRLLVFFCIAISWPYAFMQGSRNVTLFVVVPGLAAYLLLGRGSLAAKTLIGIGAFFALDYAMLAIIELRDWGFQNVASVNLEETTHLGLNMLSELTYIVGFLEERILTPTYGLGYLSELLNAVPRAIWPDKPLLGIDYAFARGFGGAIASDIGVFATISSGVVGQGVLNFGLLLGPIAAGSLMAIWVGILARLRMQGGGARNALFLLGLGLTFNLGRDITLLVFFPFVFGYIFVRLFEKYLSNRVGYRAQNPQAYRLEAQQLGVRKTNDWSSR